MGRKGLGLRIGNGNGSGKGNGRLSPASAERQQVTFGPPIDDLRKPTELRPQATPHHATIAKLIESLEGHHWIVAAVVAAGLIIAHFGWSKFLFLVVLVAGPFVGRYCLPLPETKRVDESKEQSPQDSVAWV